MKSCFLFGHADAPQSVLPDLIAAIEAEVSKDTNIFYVGNHGNFDRMATTARRKVKQRHSGATATLVLAYHPAERAIEMMHVKNESKGISGSFAGCPLLFLKD